ncbi:MAG: ABC transporter permease [Candidatus Bipolaricaulota bacterium]
MGRYVLGRAAAMGATLFSVALLIFLLLSVVPGDPARLAAGPEATPEVYEAIRDKLDLDHPWPVRFGRWLGGLIRGDAGVSLNYDRPVSELVATGLSVTLPLAVLALTLALLLGVPLGLMAASRPGGAVDMATVGVAQLGMALPEFWLGLLLAGLVGVRWGILPVGGFPGWEAPGLALLHLLLPAVALALPRAAYLARMVRGAVADVLSEDYIRAAHAKGLSGFRVVLHHALRNALVPVVTSGGLILARLFGGALVVENVFFLPGLGGFGLLGVHARDLPLVAGIAVVTAGLMVLASFTVDLAYGVLDPRIRRS